MASRQFIIAGNTQEADFAARTRPIGLKSWKFVLDAEDLRGLRPGTTVWLAGSYYEREDYDELAELCAARDIGLVRV